MPIIYRVHAVQRMFERNITDDDVLAVLADGETIERYDNDKPYPSRLILGFRGDRPLHVVAAYNDAEDETIVITVYVPDPARWNSTYRQRRTP